jgi:ABC-type uncharacterized transport system ATPase subunit
MADQSSDCILRFDGVSVRFDETPALDGLSFSIDRKAHV